MTPFTQTSGSPMKITFREMVLYHFQNLSDESAKDGLLEHYEDALDVVMDWLYWEFTENHKEFRPEYDEVMDRTATTDKDIRKRIRDKQRVLSKLLAKHKIHLGTERSVYLADDSDGSFDTLRRSAGAEHELPDSGSSENPE